MSSATPEADTAPLQFLRGWGPVCFAMAENSRRHAAKANPALSGNWSGNAAQTLPRFISCAMYPAWRSAKATIVKVGFADPGVVNTLPSEMNKFRTS